MTDTTNTTEKEIKPAVFKSDVDVELVKTNALDSDVIWAARVSTQGERSLDRLNEDEVDPLEQAKKDKGLINYLLRERHMSPFEHSSFTFYINVPIFVMRELMRHRTSSFNETSGRYKELEPVFYVPNRERNLIQVGKTGHYTFEPGTDEQYEIVRESTVEASEFAYAKYQRMLNAGIAREVARGVLPVNLFSQTYMTLNMRNLMHFLSLRTIHEDAQVKSYPQHEIALLADQMEAHFAKTTPLVYEAFNKYGRNV
jgi:thymidylate synthase (FAD)